jgi:plasmid stabilization system protein ParE
VRHSGYQAAALADIWAARAWYDQQRPGLGEEFVSAVETAVDEIVRFPDAWPEVHRGARRYLMERFPYCIYYRVGEGEVVIVALMHGARDPRRHRRRLRG